MVDGPGILKYNDFSLARLEGEDLDELFRTYIGTGDFEGPEQEIDSYRTMGNM